jgi:hypothetical protein
MAASKGANRSTIRAWSIALMAKTPEADGIDGS